MTDPKMKYADAPALDLANAGRHRAMEARGVIENVMGSLIGSVRRELQGKRKPTAEGYAAILLDDLKARGWELREIDNG